MNNDACALCLAEVDCSNCPIDEWRLGCNLNDEECNEVCRILTNALNRRSKGYLSSTKGINK